MNELWYRRLGFNSNPFSIKPAAFDNRLVAYDIDYLYGKIEKGELLFIEGDYGTGKTTILKNIIDKFRGKNKIIYYSFNAGKPFDAEELIKGANSLVRKALGMQVRNIVMLLDEVHTMNKSHAREILKYYKEGVLKSVIFVTHDYELVNFPEELESLLDGNIIQTVNLTQKEAIRLVRSRVGDIGIIPDKIIKRLFKLAEKNPRRLLEYCEDVTRYAVETGDKKVGKFHVNEVLGDVIEKKKKERKRRRKKREKSKSSKIKEKKLKEEKTIESKEEKSQETEEVKIELKENSSNKKYKVNKLVVNSKENPLGQVAEKEKAGDEAPEYNVFFLD